MERYLGRKIIGGFLITIGFVLIIVPWINLTLVSHPSITTSATGLFLGLLIGSPVSISGIALVQGNYRHVAYGFLMAGIIYTAIPIVSSLPTTLPYFLPGIAAFVFASLAFVKIYIGWRF